MLARRFPLHYLNDSLQCSFYCFYFYFTETLDNFLQIHARTHMSSVSTLTIRWNLSGPFLLCTSYYYFIAIINNYCSTGVMFKWSQSDLDVASRKAVWKESKVRKSYTDHFKNEKGVWSDRQVRLEEISCNLDWVPSPRALNIFSSLCKTRTSHCQGIFSFLFPESGSKEGSEWEGERDAC